MALPDFKDLLLFGKVLQSLEGSNIILPFIKIRKVPSDLPLI